MKCQIPQKHAKFDCIINNLRVTLCGCGVKISFWINCWPLAIFAIITSADGKIYICFSIEMRLLWRSACHSVSGLSLHSIFRLTNTRQSVFFFWILISSTRCVHSRRYYMRKHIGHSAPLPPLIVRATLVHFLINEERKCKSNGNYRWKEFISNFISIESSSIRFQLICVVSHFIQLTRRSDTFLLFHGNYKITNKTNCESGQTWARQQSIWLIWE